MDEHIVIRAETEYHTIFVFKASGNEKGEGYQMAQLSLGVAGLISLL